jgi:hypothetical protein
VFSHGHEEISGHFKGVDVKNDQKDNLFLSTPIINLSNLPTFFTLHILPSTNEAKITIGT